MQVVTNSYAKWDAYYKNDNTGWIIISIFKNEQRYTYPRVPLYGHKYPPSHMLNKLSYGAMRARMKRVKTYSITYIDEHKLFEIML